ncbi:hypothetical protein KIH39_22845 [Telmatocola sphagniphila]|uniref:Uncharacterized protein n=1 Tax=Telmatocola sphagniphila TaxID=1123043 RepID=A0A8E6B5C3_9BACT|nr:hypothetical protein [Telmatocola sphagniphila]QVL31652.1 hypothetical protein KIH39_22845 [Telmatocola sphagniphila]
MPFAHDARKGGGISSLSIEKEKEKKLTSNSELGLLSIWNGQFFVVYCGA